MNPFISIHSSQQNKNLSNMRSLYTTNKPNIRITDKNLLSRQEIASMCKSQQVKKRLIGQNSIFNKIEIEEIVAQNRRLRQQNIQLSKANNSLKVRLGFEVKDKDQILTKVDSLTFGNFDKNGSPRNANYQKKIATLKVTLREKQEMIVKLQNQIKTDRMKKRNTRIAEIEAENHELLLETLRLTEEMKKIKDNFSADSYIFQIEHLERQIKSERQQKLKAEKERQKLIVEMHALKGSFQSEKQSKSLIERQLYKQKASMKEAISKLKLQKTERNSPAESRAKELISKSKEKDTQNQNYKRENELLKNQLVMKTQEIENLKKRLSCAKSPSNSRNTAINSFAAKSPSAKVNNPQVNKNIKTVNNREVAKTDKHQNNSAEKTSKKITYNKIHDDLGQKTPIQSFEAQQKKEENKIQTQNQHQILDKHAFMNHSSVSNQESTVNAKIATEDRRIEANKKSEEIVNQEQEYGDFQEDEAIEQESLQRKSKLKESVELKTPQDSLKNKGNEAKDEQIQEDNGSDEEVQYFEGEDFQSEFQPTKAPVKKDESMKLEEKIEGVKAKSKDSISSMKETLENNQKDDKKQTKILKVTITYRLQAQQFSYEDMAGQLDSLGQPSFEVDAIDIMLKNEPFYLNEEQAGFMLAELFNGKKTVSTNNLKKRLKKFIGDIQIITADKEGYVEQIKAGFVQDKERIVSVCDKYLTKGSNCLTKKLVIKALKEIDYSEDQIEWFITESSLYSVDCSQIDYKNYIQQSSNELQKQERGNDLPEQEYKAEFD